MPTDLVLLLRERKAKFSAYFIEFPGIRQQNKRGPFLFELNRHRAKIAEGTGFSHAAERNSKRKAVGTFT